MLPLMILKEEDFTAKPDNYETDGEGKEVQPNTPEPDTDTPVPTEDGNDEDYSIDGEDEDQPVEDGDEEEPDDGEEDYTIDGDTEEAAVDDDDEEEIEPDEDGEVTADSEMPEDSDIMQEKKIKKLLKIYKSTLNTILAIQDKVSTNVFPTNSKEEYVYKIILTNLDKTRKMLQTYILDEYNTKEYEENVYRLYHFKSQLEMVHVLLKKIKSCRDINKTI